MERRPAQLVEVYWNARTNLVEYQMNERAVSVLAKMQRRNGRPVTIHREIGVVVAQVLSIALGHDVDADVRDKRLTEGRKEPRRISGNRQPDWISNPITGRRHYGGMQRGRIASADTMKRIVVPNFNSTEPKAWENDRRNAVVQNELQSMKIASLNEHRDKKTATGADMSADKTNTSSAAASKKTARVPASIPSNKLVGEVKSERETRFRSALDSNKNGAVARGIKGTATTNPGTQQVLPSIPRSKPSGEVKSWRETRFRSTADSNKLGSGATEVKATSSTNSETERALPIVSRSKPIENVETVRMPSSIPRSKPVGGLKSGRETRFRSAAASKKNDASASGLKPTTTMTAEKLQSQPSVPLSKPIRELMSGRETRFRSVAGSKKIGKAEGVTSFKRDSRAEDKISEKLVAQGDSEKEELKNESASDDNDDVKETNAKDDEESSSGCSSSSSCDSSSESSSSGSSSDCSESENSTETDSESESEEEPDTAKPFKDENKVIASTATRQTRTANKNDGSAGTKTRITSRALRRLQ